MARGGRQVWLARCILDLLVAARSFRTRARKRRHFPEDAPCTSVHERWIAFTLGVLLRLRNVTVQTI